MDFRDQAIKDALDRTVGPWRPEATPRSRRRRILLVAALAVAVTAGFTAVVQVSTPKPAPGTKAGSPVSVELLAPRKDPRP